MITPTILNISSSAISSISNTAKRIDPIGKSICETAKRALKNVDEKTKQLLNGSDQAEQFRIQIPSIDFNVPEFALNLPIIPDDQDQLNFDQDEFNINLVEQLPLPLNINGNNNELLLDLAPQIPPQYYLNLLNPNQQANNQLEIDPPYNPYNDLPPPNNPAGGIILIDLPPQEFNALPLEALQPIKVKRCAR